MESKMEFKDETFVTLWNGWVKTLRRYKEAIGRPLFGPNGISIRSIDAYTWRCKAAHAALLERFPGLHTNFSDWRCPKMLAIV